MLGIIYSFFLAHGMQCGYSIGLMVQTLPSPTSAQTKADWIWAVGTATDRTVLVHLSFLPCSESNCRSLMQLTHEDTPAAVTQPWNSTKPTTAEPSLHFAMTASPRETDSHSEILAVWAVLHASACCKPAMCCSTFANCGFATRGSTRPAPRAKWPGPWTKVEMCHFVTSRRADRSRLACPVHMLFSNLFGNLCFRSNTKQLAIHPCLRIKLGKCKL